VNKTERAAVLLMHLMRHRRLTTREAAEMCGVEARLARSDLKGLARVIPAVRFVAAGRQSCWVLDAERGLGALDRMSLLVGREATQFLEGTSLHRGIERLVRELDVPEEAVAARVHYLPEPARAYAPRDEIVDACLDGLLRARVLSLAYESGRVFERVEPRTLVIYRRALYLLGAMGAKVYIFAVDRMKDVVVPRQGTHVASVAAAVRPRGRRRAAPHAREG
jgi:predicted DNA-binding transcriptional regulator YafY